MLDGHETLSTGYSHRSHSPYCWAFFVSVALLLADESLQRFSGSPAASKVGFLGKS
jgi:hypothetical protein